MELVDPEILKLARDLPLALLGGAFVLGAILWLIGGRTHRFWLVLLTTLGPGVYGLYHGPEYGMQPLAAGLLLAVAAGALALSLMRLLFFVVGGVLTWALVHWLAPTWDEPVACFLAGGLVGVFLLRVWATALASLLGALFLSYSGLCLCDRLFRLDAAGFAAQNGALLNWAVAVLALLGVLAQYVMASRGGKKKDEDDQPEEEPEEEKPKKPKAKPRPKSFWANWLNPPRKAG
jgi:hypothetical protein